MAIASTTNNGAVQISMSIDEAHNLLAVTRASYDSNRLSRRSAIWQAICQSKLHSQEAETIEKLNQVLWCQLRYGNVQK